MWTDGEDGDQCDESDEWCRVWWIIKCKWWMIVSACVSDVPIVMSDGEGDEIKKIFKLKAFDITMSTYIS